ncbi:hypothetical protein DFH06DRAFT_1346176 [Mycena polygramma]|nr:hypothetical protein DFH06DRAFT_1346176 [Mycena polygramma]
MSMAATERALSPANTDFHRDEYGSLKSDEYQEPDLFAEPAPGTPKIPTGMDRASIPPPSLRPLTTYGEPSHKDRFSFSEERLKKKYLHLPSNLSFREFKFNLEDLKRKQEAYKLGRAAFGRAPIDVPLTRKQARRIFRHELQLLNRAMTEVFEYLEDGETPIYGLDRHLMSNLTSALASRKNRALDDFYRKAQPLPDYPVWAERGNFAQFLELNEFEIASTSFREEVERFLRNLTNYHHFPLVEDQDKFVNDYDDPEDEESGDHKGKGRTIESEIPTVTPKPSTERYKDRPIPPHLTAAPQIRTATGFAQNQPWYSNQNDSISNYAQPLNRTGQYSTASASAGPSFWGNRGTFQSSGYMREIYDTHLPPSNRKPMQDPAPLTITDPNYYDRNPQLTRPEMAYDLEQAGMSADLDALTQAKAGVIQIQMIPMMMEITIHLVVVIAAICQVDLAAMEAMAMEVALGAVVALEAVVQEVVVPEEVPEVVAGVEVTVHIPDPMPIFRGIIYRKSHASMLS